MKSFVVNNEKIHYCYVFVKLQKGHNALMISAIGKQLASAELLLSFGADKYLLTNVISLYLSNCQWI